MPARPVPCVQIGDHTIGLDRPTYFVVDVGANHDGDLERAKHLIELAAESGADAAKFQNFTAETIVSDEGFRALGGRLSHQASWSRSPYEVYEEASLDLGWTAALAEACGAVGIDFLTSPYSLELVDAVAPHVLAFKIGSGDITWPAIIERIATQGKPVLLATGASTLDEVREAVELILRAADELVLMQCNTNYTGSVENFRHVNLRVLETFRSEFPNVVLGLSDHTPGHAAVLGAVALGARVIEKHFTDDTGRVGPDHAFAMTPSTWREMVDRTRELEAALGDGVKRVEANEADTVILQRRALRAARTIAAGKSLGVADLIPLRPCPNGSLQPGDLEAVVGMRTARALERGAALGWGDVE